MRFLLLFTLILCFLGPIPSWAEDDVSPIVQACRTARAEAWEGLRYDRLWKAPEEPSEAAHQRFLGVADQCMAASETAGNRLDSAYLVAESAICKSIYEHYAGSWDKSPRPEIKKQVLREGIDLVHELDGEWSPALLELLDRLSVLEWKEEPKEASRLLEQRIEIARRTYGETDPRYAEILMRAALRYQPSYMGGGRNIRGADDPEAAELHYRTALKVFAENPKRAGSEVYRDLLSMMYFFYEGEGREKEARNLDRILDEIRLEAELDEKLSKQDEDEAASQDEGDTEPESKPEKAAAETADIETADIETADIETADIETAVSPQETAETDEEEGGMPPSVQPSWR